MAKRKRAKSSQKKDRAKQTKKKKVVETRGRKQTRPPKGSDETARIARNVRKLRDEKGLSVIDAANKARVSEAQWYKIERASVIRRTPYSTLRRIADALDSDVQALRA